MPPLDHAAIHTIIAGITLAMFLSALEQTIVAPALPAIGKSLADFDNLSWVVTAYLLAATAATPLFGKLTDIHGRRTIMLLAIGIFIVGSLACALAPTMWVLVIGRGLQGIGGGGLIPIAQTIIADILSPRERPMAQSYTSVVFMSASILGPVLGGLLTDHLHWSFIFWINLPLGAVALVMTARALRRLPRHDRPHQLDIPGVTLMVAASVALLLALDWGGTQLSLDCPGRSSRSSAASAMLWVLFAARLLTAREPFIPLAILRGRVTSAITCAAFFSIGTIVGVTIFAPLYCQIVLRRVGQPLGARADRLHGRLDHWRAADGPADRSSDPLHARAGHRPCRRHRHVRFARRRSVRVYRLLVSLLCSACSAWRSGRCIRPAPSSCRMR